MVNHVIQRLAPSGTEACSKSLRYIYLQPECSGNENYHDCRSAVRCKHNAVLDTMNGTINGTTKTAVFLPLQIGV
jgi:hypothetical protein